MSTAQQAEGSVAHGFERVRDAFVEGQSLDPGGAQLCIYRGGDVVVDLAIGRDVANARPYTRETITILMSCSKAAVALCAHRLADQGRLDLAAPVARYWPEFAANGKGDITVAHVLAHSAGLMSFDPDSGITALDMLDWNRATRSLAEMAPLWPAGTAYLYHFVTYGFLVGEVIRRVAGKSVGAYFADEIAKPLGLDLWFGLREAQEPRVAPHFRSSQGATDDLGARLRTIGIDTNHRLVRAVLHAFATTEGLIDLMTERRGRAAEVPAGNGVGNARALARLYAGALGSIDGYRMFSKRTLDALRTPQTDGLSAPPPLEIFSAAGSPQRFGLGFELPRDIMPMLGPGSFGHPGAGGRLGFADPESGYAVGYACNNLLWDGLTKDPRWIWANALREIAAR